MVVEYVIPFTNVRRCSLLTAFGHVTPLRRIHRDFRHVPSLADRPQCTHLPAGFVRSRDWAADCPSCRGRLTNALNEHCRRTHRRRRSVVASESLYPDGFQHQGDPHRDRGGRRVRLSVTGDRTAGTGQ